MAEGTNPKCLRNTRLKCDELEKPHEKGTLTLVVVNRVARAQEIYKALTTAEKKSKQPLYDSTKVALIHSRFRPIDRERHTRLLFGDGDRIVIATQAVEAGVDVSARLLVTELAPWSSLVQRMGRCNRRADISDAQVLWVDIQPKDEKDDLLRPYSTAELSKARAAVDQLSDASPHALGDVVVPPEAVVRPVIRRLRQVYTRDWRIFHLPVFTLRLDGQLPRRRSDATGRCVL
jgi:CRISPR-associated endonuclease/helicase Cas3